MPRISNPGVASVAMIRGYRVRAGSEKISCGNCTALLQGSTPYTPLQGLIAHQDRGGLCYPSSKLIKLLAGLNKFADTILFCRKSNPKPPETRLQRSVRILTNLPLPIYGNEDKDHWRQLLEFITKKFMKPLFSIYVLRVTDRNTAVNLFQRKLLSSKVLRL